MTYFADESQMSVFSEIENSVDADKESGKRKDRLSAVVTRIGPEPLLKIEGVGEIRFAYRNVKKKHGDARPFIQVGDNVECRLTKSNPPKAVSVRLMKKVGSEQDQTEPIASTFHEAYRATPKTEGKCAADMKPEPTRFVHNPYGMDKLTAADKNLAAALNDSPLLCDEIDAGDLDAAIDGCLNDCQIDGLCDYYPTNNKKKIADDSCSSCDCGSMPPRCFSAPASFNEEMMMLTAFEYSY